MKLQVNRVLLAFKTWDDKKNELQALSRSGAMDERILDKLQLEHLRQAKHRLRDNVRPDEQPFMALLNNHVSRLEKKLYTNMLQRILLRLKHRFIDGPAYLQREAQRRTANMEQLKQQLRDKQLWEIAGKLEDHLNPDHKQVCLPLDCQINDQKRLNYDLWFEKDVYGNFQWTRLDGTLKVNGQETRSYEFELQDWPGLKANQVWSLLEGRALKQNYIDATGHDTQRWVQLGAEGVKHYGEPLFDVADIYKSMPQIGSSKPELTKYLENGQRAPALWKVGHEFQHIYVQADPANRSFKFYDAKEKPITPEKLNENAKKLTPGVISLNSETRERQQQKKRNGHRMHI